MGGDAKGMELEWKLTLVDTHSYEPMTWDLLTWNATIEEIKEHPMPRSISYKSVDELIAKIEKAEDKIISIANNETEEFKSWFLELIDTCCW